MVARGGERTILRASLWPSQPSEWGRKGVNGGRGMRGNERCLKPSRGAKISDAFGKNEEDGPFSISQSSERLQGSPPPPPPSLNAGVMTQWKM